MKMYMLKNMCELVIMVISLKGRKLGLEEAIQIIDSDVDLALNMFNNCLKDAETCMKKCSIVKWVKQRQECFD